MSDSSFSYPKPEESPGLLLWQTTVTWQRRIKEALEPYQLSHSQFVILAILLWFTEQKELPTQIQLVRLSKLDKMTISISLKKLSAAGLVKRSEYEQDTRAKAVALTEEGSRLIKNLVPIIESIDKAFFQCTSSQEQEDLLTILRKLAAQED